MKKPLLLLALLLATSANASNFDVIYRFDSVDSDDYFKMKVDFDFVAPQDIFFFDEEVFNYEQFIDVLLAGENFPVFFFEVVIIETNMPFQLVEPVWGYTSIVADDYPLKTILVIDGLGYFATYSEPLEFVHFPTGWEPGQTIEQFTTSDQIPFVLTEITQVPLPAALPLFGMALLILARPSRRFMKTH